MIKIIMKSFKPLATGVAVIFCFSCNSPTANEKLKLHTAQIDSIRRMDDNFFGWNKNSGDRTANYTWFNLGEDNHQIIDKLFYVASIKTSFKENGFLITGTIGNICSMTINNTIIECAIKDSTLPSKIVTGFSDVSDLLPGDKVSFSVFVATSQTKVSEIGITVKDFRM